MPDIITALIFDFDGLIVDTETPDYQAWQEVFAAHDLDLPMTTWALNVGSGHLFSPYDHLEARLGHPVDRASVRHTVRTRFRTLLGEPVALPGVVDYLAAAAGLGLQVGLASSSSRAWVTGYLEQLGLCGHFATICTADDVTRTKPEPDLYLTALARTQRACRGGDRPGGLAQRGARGAGRRDARRGRAQPGDGADGPGPRRPGAARPGCAPPTGPAGAAGRATIAAT